METTVDSQIIPRIPEGKFEAPGDYELLRKNIVIEGQELPVRLIKQTYAGHDSDTGELNGNCAEYATLNAAIVMYLAGFKLNKDIEKLILLSNTNNKELNLDRIEKNMIVPLIVQAQDHLMGAQVPPEDTANLAEKLRNPYAALTIRNTVFLFRYALSENPKNVFENDVVTLENIDTHFADQKFGAFMIGKHNPEHAVALVANGNEYFVVDTYSQDIVTSCKASQAKEYLINSLRDNSFVTFNPAEKLKGFNA